MFKIRGPRAPSRAALITGASRGIGAALAAALPRSTALLLAGRDEAALAEVAQAQRYEGRRVDIVTADLATTEGRSSVADAAAGFEIDLLIANAGKGDYGAFLDVGRTAHRDTIDVNVTAAVELIHALTPGMLARARSSGQRAGLMTIASTAAFVPVPRLAIYAASKAFLLSFTEALTAELAGDPIDVLCVCPGATRTAFGTRAGWQGGDVPGAMQAERVAAAALSALGVRRTLVIDPLPAPLLAPIALARALCATALHVGGTAVTAGSRPVERRAE